METITVQFSHLDTSVFHKNKSIYSEQLMLKCLIKSSVANHLCGKNPDYRIRKDVFGKPHGMDRMGSLLPVSTSHAYPYLYAAASHEDVLLGCDVESIRTFDDFFLTSFLCTNEFLYIKSIDSFLRDEVATQAWTIKEAFLKAIGKGLRIHPRRLDVSTILKGRGAGEYSILFDGEAVHCTVGVLLTKDRFVFSVILTRDENIKKCKL